MIDEIYYRLLVELTPESFKPSELDYERVIADFGKTQESQNAYGSLIRAIYEADPLSNIGLHYGKLLQPHALCDFSRALMTAPSFNHCIDIINELHYMQGAAYYLSTDESDDTISISLTYPYKKEISYAQQRFCAEAVFTYLLNLARACIDSEVTPTALWLDYAEPDYSDDYVDIYGLEPNYKAPISLLEFSSTLGSRELSTSNHTLHSAYLKKCLHSARSAERYWSFDYRSSNQLMRHVPEAFNSESLAKLLSISARGLQKKLSNLGTSFSNLSSQARIEQAKILLLQKNKSIDATAELLGFQTASGFRRFFKSEFGISVGEFLEQASKTSPPRTKPQNHLDENDSSLASPSPISAC